MSAPDDDPVRVGLESALRLQRLFTCMAETREARAMCNYAAGKLALASLQESIASAISRGHLRHDFFTWLQESTK